MNEAISKLKKCGMHTAIILGLMFALRSTAHANENMAVLQKVHDKKSDSVFVVLFYEANGNENEDEGDEMMGDFSYHVGEAFKKIKKWRLIEVNSKNEPEITQKLNPKGDWLFEIWYQGKAIMQSQGVATDTEISEVMKKNHLVEK